MGVVILALARVQELAQAAVVQNALLHAKTIVVQLVLEDVRVDVAVPVRHRVKMTARLRAQEPVQVDAQQLVLESAKVNVRQVVQEDAPTTVLAVAQVNVLLVVHVDAPTIVQVVALRDVTIIVLHPVGMIVLQHVKDIVTEPVRVAVIPLALHIADGLHVWVRASVPVEAG